MKQIIFATNNPTKARRFSKNLSLKGIEVLSLKDINLELHVEEKGETAIENALLKVRTCFELTKMPSMGMDDTLYFEGVPLEAQPGLFVRRVNGKELTDEEMIEHYTNLVKKYGHNGRLDCKWIYGLAVINEKGEEKTFTWAKDDFYMVDVPSSKRDPGYPLNSISKYKKTDKYFTDTTDSEKEAMKINEDHVVGFIVKQMNGVN